MLTILTGLGAALGVTAHDYLAMVVTRRASVFVTLFWVQAVAFVAVVPVWLIFIGLPQGAEEWRAAGLAAASGPLWVIGMAALFRGLRVGKFAIVGPLGALAGGFGALYSVLLGEPVVGLATIGLPLAVLGTVLASAERIPGREEFRMRATSGAGWGLLCAAVMGLEPVLFGAATELSPLAIVAISRAGALVLLVPLVVLWVGVRLNRADRRLAAVAGVADVAAWVCLGVATGIGPVSTASVLIGQAGTLSAVIGVWVLRERLSKIQLVGIAATVVAVTLLALAS